MPHFKGLVAFPIDTSLDSISSNIENTLLTSSTSSGQGGYNAPNWHAMLDRINSPSESGPASTQSNNTSKTHQGQGQNTTAPRQGPSATLSTVQTTRQAQHPPCPFHGPILQVFPTPYRQGQGLDPMARFLGEGPSQQHAMFVRPDTGKLSTSRGCTCRHVALESEPRKDT